MSIYFRSSMGIDFPKAPYIGQVHYDFDLKRTFRYEEKPPEMQLWENLESKTPTANATS